jgi:hypothetical protein
MDITTESGCNVCDGEAISIELLGDIKIFACDDRTWHGRDLPSG